MANNLLKRFSVDILYRYIRWSDNENITIVVDVEGNASHCASTTETCRFELCDFCTRNVNGW